VIGGAVVLEESIAVENEYHPRVHTESLGLLQAHGEGGISASVDNLEPAVFEGCRDARDAEDSADGFDKATIAVDVLHDQKGWALKISHDVVEPVKRHGHLNRRLRPPGGCDGSLLDQLRCGGGWQPRRRQMGLAVCLCATAQLGAQAAPLVPASAEHPEESDYRFDP
jgi:hypothetical protein